MRRGLAFLFAFTAAVGLVACGGSAPTESFGRADAEQHPGTERPRLGDREQDERAYQRPGPVSFATVVLKRGMTASRDLFKWFQLVNGGGYAYRLSAEIDMRNAEGATVVTWGLDNCLPVKFKAADLNAKGTEVGIEELHLAHEGLRLIA